MASAVRGLSPVSITTLIPRFFSSRIAWALSGLLTSLLSWRAAFLTSGLVTAAAMAIIILLAYTYLQGVRRKLRYQLPGTLFTTLLWLGFSSLFEMFIKRFWQASSLYGSLASVFLAAMWLKTIVMILFYGAALNEALIHRAAEKRADN